LSTAYIFPGQGAQQIGMGSDFYNSELCKTANDICGFDLLGIMKDGPAESLTSTTYCQPALFLHSALVLDAMQKEGVDLNPEYFLGLSLGEYSAMYAAGAMKFEDVMQALVVRGKAMQDACESEPGGMLTVIGLDDEAVIEACEQARENSVLQAANFNAPGQIVLSGQKDALERAAEILKEKGARRAMMLNVAGAFHSPLMQSAADKLKECLEKMDFQPGVEKVVSNVTARPHDPNVVIDTLVSQITAPVAWTSSIQWLAEERNVDTFVELGTGKVLTGLVKRIAPESTRKNAEGAEDIQGLMVAE
jgi:[acyl-carrier-protein] S-malonyltransferase